MFDIQKNIYRHLLREQALRETRCLYEEICIDFEKFRAIQQKGGVRVSTLERESSELF